MPRSGGISPILLAGFQLRRDKTYLIDTGVTHDVNGTRHLSENNIVITFNESHFFGSQLENVVKARSKTVPISVVFIDFQLIILEDLNDDCLGLDVILVLLIRLRR